MHPLDWQYFYSITDFAALAEAAESDFIPTEGFYASLEGARRAGEKRYENYGVVAMKEPDDADFEIEIEKGCEGFLKHLENLHELYGNPFPYLAPRIYIDNIYVFDPQIRTLTPEVGIELFGEDREEAIRRTRRSRHFDPKEMFLNTQPAWLYRLEPRYHGDLYTLTPRVPVDAFDFVAADEFEDYTIPRIPVCRKLTNCRMSAVHHNFLPFVYMSVAPHVTVMPSVDLVFDAPETAERWIIPPPEDHSFICVCKLKRRVKMMVEKIINPAYFALMQEDQKKLGLDLIL